LAHLTGAYLFRANLTGTHLLGAYLSGADLMEAHLTGALLFGAGVPCGLARPRTSSTDGGLVVAAPGVSATMQGR
jgi:uncharacterized protein YjbI with pentapeptide repeats